MNPYAPPLTTEVPESKGARWCLKDGALWVKDGAMLPEICLHGTAEDRPTGRRTLKLDSHSPAAKRLEVVIPVVGSVLMIWATWKGFNHAATIIMFITLLASLAGTTWSKKAGYSQMIEVHCSAGKRAALKEAASWTIHGLVFLFIIYAVFNAENWSVEPIHGLYLCMLYLINKSWITDLLSSWFFPAIHGHEQGWYRLKNIHASALAKLKEIQAERLAGRRVIRDDS